MTIPLNKAPFNTPLKLAEVMDFNLLQKFQHLGLYENDVITKLDEDILLRPVKIKGPKGMVILGAGMSSKIVAHLDDGPKIPIAELKNGQSAHIEGVTGGTALAKSMKILGLKNDDEITVIRTIPPMEYTLTVNSQTRVKISEVLAAKIWGCTSDGRDMQFSSSGKGKDFRVKQILGGKKSPAMIFTYGGIETGAVLCLENVKPMETLAMSPVGRQSVIIYKNDGLRLIIEKKQCGLILVKPID